MPDKTEQELLDFLGDDYSALTDSQKIHLKTLYQKERKNDFIYFWWFFNLHYAVVKKWKLLILFLLSFGGLCIWWLVDLFRIPTILKEYNSNKARELIEEVTKNEPGQTKHI